MLRERLKEITCLYEIRRGMGLELTIDKACQNIFEHLIPAMRFPEIATAVIELDGKRFASRNLDQSLANELQSEIVLMIKYVLSVVQTKLIHRVCFTSGD